MHLRVPLPCRGSLGCRFRNLALPCRPVTRPQCKVTAQCPLNTRATVLQQPWRLLSGGGRQKLLLNKPKERRQARASVGWPNTSRRLLGCSTALNVAAGRIPRWSGSSRAHSSRALDTYCSCQLGIMEMFNSCDCAVTAVYTYPMLCFVQIDHTTVLYPPPNPLLAWYLTYAFLPSSTQNTVLATAIRCRRSDNPNASVWNTCCSGGK